MKKQILYMLCATALLSSCHIYKSYDRPEDITTSGLYRDPVADNDTLVSDTANFGNLPWREVFTDPVSHRNGTETKYGPLVRRSKCESSRSIPHVGTPGLCPVIRIVSARNDQQL